MQGRQSVQEAPVVVQRPVKATHRRTVRRCTVRRGMRIFGKSLPLANVYLVASGEVMILRGGQLVDLVEAGELLDQRIWRDATAIAHSDCMLAPPAVAA